jgi:Flp pilus assembly pilin Flp
MEKMDLTLRKLWQDQSGFIVSIELVLIATILVIGLITGLNTLRNAVTSELSDVAGAVQDMNQSYTYNGVAGHSSRVQGSNFTDIRDWCDTPEDAFGLADNCISFLIPPQDEL